MLFCDIFSLQLLKMSSPEDRPSDLVDASPTDIKFFICGSTSFIVATGTPYLLTHTEPIRHLTIEIRIVDNLCLVYKILTLATNVEIRFKVRKRKYF